MLVLASCGRSRDETSTEAACRCTPGNVSLTKNAGEAQPMDGIELLARLRRHQAQVRDGMNRRDVKVFDDELKLAIIGFCQPCSEWISDRVTIEQMFPFGKLDAAALAVCMGLVLRDGTTVYGDAHPKCPPSAAE